jgi:hypothetical protein
VISAVDLTYVDFSPLPIFRDAAKAGGSRVTRSRLRWQAVAGRLRPPLPGPAAGNDRQQRDHEASVSADACALLGLLRIIVHVGREDF